MKDHNEELLVFDIQRFCLHDGSGIRTVVFLKGCPLQCLWCQNPESLRNHPEIAEYSERCIDCRQCLSVCSNKALSQSSPRIDHKRCQACGNCTESCPTEALRLIGRRLSPSALFDELASDRPYFEASQGGITLSGGEPLQQYKAASIFLGLCKKEGLNTLIETSGVGSVEALSKLIPVTDQWFFDLKAGTHKQYRELVGASLDMVLKNAKILTDSGAHLTYRTPLIPGLNDDEKSLAEISSILKELGANSVTLLPYHRGGESKLDRICSTLKPLGLNSKDAVPAADRAARRFASWGIHAHVEKECEHSRASAGQGPMSDRLWRLRRTVQEEKPTICAERALLLTEYYRKADNRKKPAIIQRAEALRHILRHKKAIIYPDELLVGCFSSKRVGGSLLPELHGVAMLEDLLRFDRREVNPLRIDNGDRLALATRVLPFWATRFLAIKAFPLLKALRFIVDQLSFERYVINETGGISHFVPDYERLLRQGTSGIAAQAKRLGDEYSHNEERRLFYESVDIVCKGLEEMAAGFVVTALALATKETSDSRRKELLHIADVCKRVPKYPARTLHEGLQSILFAQIALNLESLDNAISPGRLDQILWSYCKKDLQTGKLTPEHMRELVGCFTVKLSEIVPIFSRRLTRIHGGFLSGQAVVVGGVDRDGKDGVNELTFAFLDSMEFLRMRQPNYHARIHRGSPHTYISRISTMLRNGSSSPSLMNDDVVIPLLEARGIERAAARNYSPVGCVEPVSCGSTFGSTDAAIVNLALCLERALGLKKGGVRAPLAAGCTTQDGLLHLLDVQISALISDLIADLKAIERANARFHPTPLSSALLRGCLEQGRDSTDGGARYNASGIQPVGIVEIAESLAAIESVVFQRRRCTMAELIEALTANFVGYEYLHGHLLRAPKFGNDDQRIDRILEKVTRCVRDALSKHRNTRGGPYLVGLYSVTAHVAFGSITGALPSGRPAGAPFASGLSPSGGQDRLGPTAALNSAASLSHQRFAKNGVTVNIKLDRSALPGPEGAEALSALVRGYMAKGGMQVQINVLDPALLVHAAENPEAYPWLLVRVSGYSAYFNDLSPEVQRELIARTAHGPPHQPDFR